MKNVQIKKNKTIFLQLIIIVGRIYTYKSIYIHQYKCVMVYTKRKKK